MTINNIYTTIKSLFTKSRKPLSDLSDILVLCSTVSRPGLSAIYSTAKAVQDLAASGVPLEASPDGTPNLTVACVYSIMKEQIRALHEDAKIQTSIYPGSLNIVGTGANAGGAVTVVSTNMTAGHGSSQLM